MEILNVLPWALLALFVVIVAIATIFTIVKFVREKKKAPKKANPVVVKDDVRLTPTDEIKNEDDSVKISYVEKDILLQPRKVKVVGDKKGQLKPGKYTVLSAYQNEEKFNIRIGNFVKEYTHGQEIVLAEGDEICPTSTTIILR
ncbi:MAG: hypothetical protein K6F08_01185 [bacterium]|nr:hypothetical protein [bacterium]